MVVRIYEGEVHQGRLASAVKELFLSENVQQNVRKEGAIKNPFTGSYLELDVWIPELNVCFEFQDNYHYVYTWYSHVPLDIIQQKDAAKQQVLQSRGITLVLVPFWWDGSNESLRATIRFQRPDLLQSDSKEAEKIPLNPSIKSLTAGRIPDVGELMLASFPGVTQLDFDSPWWVGEKYDGLRFCWHPEEKELFSRYGLKLDVAEPFYDHFSDIFYDGELWFGRGCFPETQKIVNTPANVDWQTMRVVTFDNAEIVSRTLPFEERYGNLLQIVEFDHPFTIVAPRVFCTTNVHITNWLQFVIEDGGEGIIARSPKSFYEPGRTPLLFKLKASRGDREALVVSAENGEIQLQMPDGITFEIHKPHLPLKMGDIVTFTYDRYSRYEVPVNPIIQRIRSDVAWEDILRDFAENSAQSQVMTDYTHKVVGNFTQKPIGFWKSEKKNNSRAFFESFARANQFDPLVAENWYFMCSEFYATKGARSILHHHKYSYSQALMDVFPDIGLVQTKFSTLPRKYWNSVGNRLECFNSFANKMGFDPLEPENWYYATFLDILTEYKGALSVISQYGGFNETLQHLYPDIGIDERKIKVKRFYLQDIEKRRKQFLDFAKAKNIDPLVPENWYSVTHEDLFPFKGIVSMFVHYRGSFASALILLFPEITFDRSKFNLYPDIYWEDVGNQRKVFESFAKIKGMNASSAHFWHDINNDELLTINGAWQVLKKYSGEVERAIIALFPNVNLHKPQVGKEISAKKFFTNFAKDYGFDALVPSNWYSLTSTMLSERKGAKNLLAKFGGRIWAALSDAFPSIRLDPEFFELNPREQWSDLANRRKFFTDFAKRKGFDPLIAANWYSITRNDISVEKNSGLVLMQNSGSFLKSLFEAYPNIGLDAAKFSFVNRGYWSDRNNRKKYFDDIAKEHNFDPLDPEKWYDFPFGSLSSSKSPVSLYSGSHRRALADVYPSVKFDSKRFGLERGHWDSKSNRKKFFDEFAAENQFNPFIPEHWYKISSKKIWAKKSAGSVLQHYGGNFMTALIDVYPNIGLKEEKFRLFLSTYWIKTKTRRKFFDDFAKEKAFDPLEAANWYKVQLREFQSKKHAISILRYYKGSLKKALLHVYPDIGLNFSHAPSKDLEEQKKRRNIFADFAAKNRFDPLVEENWHNNYDKLAAIQNAAEVLLYYKGSITRALADVYPNHFKSASAEKRGHWDNPENRKQFFEKFAQDYAFDSNNANNWYKVSVKDILSRKSLSSVLIYHDGSYKKALCDLYPHLNLQISSFS